MDKLGTPKSNKWRHTDTDKNILDSYLEAVDNGDKALAELRLAIEKCVELDKENAALAGRNMILARQFENLQTQYFDEIQRKDKENASLQSDLNRTRTGYDEYVYRAEKKVAAPTLENAGLKSALQNQMQCVGESQ